MIKIINVLTETRYFQTSLKESSSSVEADMKLTILPLLNRKAESSMFSRQVPLQTVKVEYDSDLGGTAELNFRPLGMGVFLFV